MVIIPAVEVKLPLTVKLPVRLTAVAVITEPLIVRLSGEIPDPVIVALPPLIVSVPPEAWLKEPDPVVARLPVKVMALLEKVIPGAATVRLLKFSIPVPLMEAPDPVKVMVLVLPLKVPLFVQLPPMECR